MKYEELLKEIEKETDANGDKLFRVWISGNEAKFKRLLEEA